jgi:hypothetical protein
MVYQRKGDESMKTIFVGTIIFLLSTALLFANPSDFVPRDVGFSLFVGNASSANDFILNFIEEEIPERVSDLVFSAKDTFILLTGCAKLHGGLLESMDEGWDSLDDVVLEVIQQPVALITNALSVEGAKSVIYPIVEPYLLVAENDETFDYSIEGVPCLRYPVRSIEYFPPVIADLFIVEIERNTIISSDETLVRKIIRARGNPDERLSTYSDFSRQILDAYNRHQLVFYSSAFPFSNPAMRAAGINVGNAGDFAFTVSFSDSLSFNCYQEVNYQSPASKEDNLSQNLPLSGFINAPVYENYPFFFRSKPRIISISWVVELLEELLYYTDWDINLDTYAVRNYDETLSVPGIFKDYATGVSYWGDIEERRYTLLLDTQTPLDTLKFLGFLVGAEVQERETCYELSEYGNYGYASKTGSLVEISNDASESMEVVAKYLTTSSIKEIRPEWEKRLLEFPDGLLFAFFCRDDYSLLSGFDRTGNLWLSLDIGMRNLIVNALRRTTREEFDKIAATCEDLFYYIYDRISQTEDGLVDVSLLDEEAEFYLDYPELYKDFSVEVRALEGKTAYLITYLSELPESYTYDDLKEELEYILAVYEIDFEIIDGNPVLIFLYETE